MIDETLTPEDFAKVPEKFRDLYTERDGAFVLDAVPRKVSNSALNAKREAEQRASKTASAYEGLDPDEVKSAVELKRSLEQQELLKKGDVDGLLERERKKYATEHAKLLAERDEKLSQSNAQLARLLRDDAITKAALAAGVRSEALDLVQQGAAGALRVEGGKLVDATGEEVDAGAWVKEFTAKRKFLLGDSTGGGTAKGSGGGVAPTSKPRSKMSIAEKSQLVSKIGVEAFLKIPEK